MIVRVYEPKWNKCASCGGTGRVRQAPDNLLIALRHTRISSYHLGLLAQGKCLVCEGRGHYKTEEVLATHSLSLWERIKYWMTGRLPHGSEIEHTR